MFEALLCRYTGFQHAVCVDSCTNALMIALEAQKCLGMILHPESVHLSVPTHTYLSVPMTLLRNGWSFDFVELQWVESYSLGCQVVDAATHFERDMSSKYAQDETVCVSFQQKKRLNLDQGGAIFTNNEEIARLARRLRHDGRDPKLAHIDEVQQHPDDIILGWHAYLSPAKAARGILALNQEQLLPPYTPHSWKDYPDISHLKCFQRK